MAAVRLRKAFHYPEDSDNENERDELDEEEQERVIEQLQRQNDARNAQYNVNRTGLTRCPLLLGPFSLSQSFSLNPVSLFYSISAF